MYLTKVTKPLGIPTDEVLIGYKAVNWKSKESVQAEFSSDIWEFGKWYDARNWRTMVETGDDTMYPAGIHVMPNFYECQQYAGDWMSDFVQVEYKGVLAVGKFGNKDVVVVKSIRVLGRLGRYDKEPNNGISR